MATKADIDVARALIAHMGIAPEELFAGYASDRPPMPTFAEFLPVVERTVSVGTRRCYGSYWKKVLAVWSDRRLDEPLPSEIADLAEQVKIKAVTRRSGRGGVSAAEHLIGALRCLYRVAVDDGLIAAADDPSRKVTKPKRLPSRRRGLENELVDRITEAAATTGNDPALDALLIRFHVETAARRGGALALTLDDLDQEQCLVQLHEKGGTSRWQPVSPTLMTHLVDHAHLRGAQDGSSPVLRYHNGDPLTYRRYDGLWRRIGQHVEPVYKQGISTHWLRYTTLKWVRRNFGYAVAQAFAGHADSASDHHGATAIYVRAGIDEVAAALSALTGEPHPLAGGTRL
ncbi:tyrosine-type recombinase/integrase [Saccharothrix stipae]